MPEDTLPDWDVASEKEQGDVAMGEVVGAEMATISEAVAAARAGLSPP